MVAARDLPHRPRRKAAGPRRGPARARPRGRRRGRGGRRRRSGSGRRPRAASYRSCRACPSAPPAIRSTASASARSTRAASGPTARRPCGATRPVHGNFFGQSSFATHALAYENNAVVVDGGVDLERGRAVRVRVQTGAGAVINVLELDERSSFVVYGAGGVGLRAVMAAVPSASRRSRVDPVREPPGARARARRHARARPGDGDVVAAIADLTGGGADTAFDTTALVERAFQALDCLCPRGTCVALGVGMPAFALRPGTALRGKSRRRRSRVTLTRMSSSPRLLELHARWLNFPSRS